MTVPHNNFFFETKKLAEHVNDGDGELVYLTKTVSPSSIIYLKSKETILNFFYITWKRATNTFRNFLLENFKCT